MTHDSPAQFSIEFGIGDVQVVDLRFEGSFVGFSNLASLRVC